jgi:hypothetical protein
MSAPSDFTPEDVQPWRRTVVDFYFDFREFSLCGVTSECNGYELARFGKPDVLHQNYLGYLDLGLEFLAGKHYIGYTWIMTTPIRRGCFGEKYLPPHAEFAAFPGQFRYGSRVIERHELGNSESLVSSFNDDRIIQAPDDYDAYLIPLSDDYLNHRRKVVFSTDRSGAGAIISY